ncbi:MAG TPA: sigma-54 dependent transcriptional regulator [Candidatus Binataceae bacterium]|nr:sigma-54 dependent transcriptional regulator [Candidatus Binataceae bacterium]
METKGEDLLEVSELCRGSYEFGGMLVKSAEDQRLARTIARLAPYRSTVLIQGESGTGKDLAAQALHKFGPDPEGPFVSFNCSNLIPSLAESQLFGHVKGAFTDAREEMIGYFRSANGGTLFLDEIGELPLALQPKLLRTVETHEVQPVGAARPCKVNIRLIVATNRDLRAMVAAGTFRADLYYRLNATMLKIPPLSLRRDAIDAFVGHFIRLSNERYKKRIAYIARDALELLQSRPWPGNLRELRHAIEAAVILAEDDRIDLSALPESIFESDQQAAASNDFQFLDEYRTREPFPAVASVRRPLSGASGHRLYREDHYPPSADSAPGSYTLDDAIKSALLRALHKTNGNCHHSAQLLGISRYTVYRMMTRYGLGQVRNYRESPPGLDPSRKAS